MLIEYQNKIIRREERLDLSFCGICPLRYFDPNSCYFRKIPYTCPVTGTVTLDTSEIFNL